MSGGSSFISDQKFTTLTADGNFKTITGGSTNLGPCRVTYIQAHAASNAVVKLHDGTGTGGPLEFQAKFGSEGLDLMVPGSGIRFRTGVFLDLDQTDSVTIGYTG
tara:strand:+ start:175 stop:489 length:315 start_codon:yes stop_codon:yes gene_type:complete